MKINKPFSIRFSFIQLFFICCLAGQSQNNCLCKEVDQKQFDRFMIENDSVSIQGIIAGLKESGDKNCRVIAYNLELDQLFSPEKTRQNTRTDTTTGNAHYFASLQRESPDKHIYKLRPIL